MCFFKRVSFSFKFFLLLFVLRCFQKSTFARSFLRQALSNFHVATIFMSFFQLLYRYSVVYQKLFRIEPEACRFSFPRNWQFQKAESHFINTLLKYLFARIHYLFLFEFPYLSINFVRRIYSIFPISSVVSILSVIYNVLLFF